jgi:hypothetical protein
MQYIPYRTSKLLQNVRILKNGRLKNTIWFDTSNVMWLRRAQSLHQFMKLHLQFAFSNQIHNYNYNFHMTIEKVAWFHSLLEF